MPAEFSRQIPDADAQGDNNRAAIQTRAHIEAGIEFGACNQFAKAIEAFDAALILSPTCGEAWACRGLALEQLRKFELAYDAYAQAAALTPFYAEARDRIAALGPPLGRPGAVLAPWREKPAPRWGARIYQKLKKRMGLRRRWESPPIEESEKNLRRDLVRAPGSAGRAVKLAQYLHKSGRLIEAEHFLRYALMLTPWSDEAATLLCLIVEAGPDSHTVKDIVRGALEAGATDEGLPVLALWNTRMACDWAEERYWLASTLEALRKRPVAVPAFTALHVADDPVLQHAAAAACARTMAKGASRWPGPFRRSPDRPITLGYLSADFRKHAVARLIAEVFELHDRTRFRVFGYSVFSGPDSEIGRRIRTSFDNFTDLAGMPAATAAARIARDRVDILIDLTGYTGHSPASITARKPAPVQVNYLGYPGTLAMPAVDYAIVDKTVVPREHQRWFDEALVYMPDCYQANDRRRKVSRKLRSRADFGFPSKSVVYCAFNNPRKLTPEIFDVWMRILARVPDSFLWLYAPRAVTRANLEREAAARKIDPGRLKFASDVPHDEHQARYLACDLFLDTPVYNGHTTASDALWNGCPFVTVMGNTFPARVGASILRAAGLPELVATSLADYEDLAVRIGLDGDLRRDLRARVEASRATCALFDTPRFTRHLEWAFEHMWGTYVAGRSPEAFEVPAASG